MSPGRKQLGRYRDLALSVVGGLSMLFAWVFLTDQQSASASPIDWKLGVGCVVVAMVVVCLSPNHAKVLAGSFGVVGGLALLHFCYSRDMTALKAGVLMLILIAVVAVGAGVIMLLRHR